MLEPAENDTKRLSWLERERVKVGFAVEIVFVLGLFQQVDYEISQRESRAPPKGPL